ncbi:MAG: hypothetical protein HYV41_03535 [Candidatus Magasanikbacteria bacterium]|nr:hypothetical protein [Candidatus Magasanikbacteria bacterium]
MDNLTELQRQRAKQLAQKIFKTHFPAEEDFGAGETSSVFLDDLQRIIVEGGGVNNPEFERSIK